MDIKSLFDNYKDKTINEQPLNENWLLIYLRLTLFTKGIKPNFYLPVDSRINNTLFQRQTILAQQYERILTTEVFTRYPYDTLTAQMQRRSMANIDAIKDLIDKFYQELQSVLFQGNNFTIKTDNKLLNEWIIATDFNSFIKDDLLKEMLLNDPNGLVVISDGHEEEFDVNIPAIPKIEIVYSNKIKRIDDNCVVWEDGAIDYNQCYNKKTDLIYTHNFGELPIVQLGGIKLDKNIYESFISGIFGNASKYIQFQTDSEIEFKTIATRFEIQEPTCKMCNGSGINTMDKDKKCGVCNGEGVVKMNLGSVITYPDTHNADGNTTPIKRFNYTQANTSYLEILLRQMDAEYAKIEKKLGVYSIDGGTAKSADFLRELRNQRTLLFGNIGNRLTELINQILYFVLKVLNQTTNNGVYKLIIPQTYDLITIDEILIKLENEKKFGLPITIINETEKNYIEKLYGENTSQLREVEFLQLYDCLYGVPDNTILSGYDNEIIVVHKLLAYYLNRWIYKNGRDVFMNVEFDKLYNELLIEMRPKIDSMPIL